LLRDFVAVYTSPMSFRAEIQGQAVDVDDRETLLDAALRAGIDFPHSCKVGGCGTCACRIAGGRVRELIGEV
ncbi:MAG: 2Fe-2S iron-sulfur cluster-binding protein, partial [Myxococcota bacterium]